MTQKERKQKCWDKKYKEAPYIKCACGCNKKLKNVDHYGRTKTYINGHNGRKYNDCVQYKREWNYRNREQRFKYKAKWARKLKGELIRKKGSKCKKCDYKYTGKNAAAFDFHHRNPETKKLYLSLSGLTRFSRKKVDAELKKCDLLCSCCHRILHSGEY